MEMNVGVWLQQVHFGAGMSQSMLEISLYQREQTNATQKPTSHNGCLPCFCPSISLGLERVERTTRGGKMDTVELETANRGNSLFTLREILSSPIMTSDYRS